MSVNSGFWYQEGLSERNAHVLTTKASFSVAHKEEE